MSYPQPGIYLIQSSSNPDLYASVHSVGDRALRTESINFEQYYQLWRLAYVDDVTDGPKVSCVIRRQDETQVGVNSIHNNQAVYSLIGEDDDEQIWFLSQTDEGYAIGLNGNNKQYTWRHGATGEPIVITSHGTQSWKFVASE